MQNPSQSDRCRVPGRAHNTDLMLRLSGGETRCHVCVANETMRDGGREGAEQETHSHFYGTAIQQKKKVVTPQFQAEFF